MEYCPGCGTPIANDAFFCYHCGKSLRICPSCSFKIPRDMPIEALFCPNCGQRLSWIKWSVGDAFKVFIFSIVLLIPFILLLSLVFAPFVMIAGIEVPFFITLSSNHLLLLIFTLYYIRKRGGSLKEVGIALAKPKFIAIGVLTGIAVLVLNVAVSILSEPFIGASPVQEEFVRMGEAQDMFPIFFFFVSVIAPTIEEIYFSGIQLSSFQEEVGKQSGNTH